MYSQDINRKGISRLTPWTSEKVFVPPDKAKENKLNKYLNTQKINTDLERVFNQQAEDSSQPIPEYPDQIDKIYLEQCLIELGYLPYLKNKNQFMLEDVGKVSNLEPEV